MDVRILAIATGLGLVSTAHAQYGPARGYDGGFWQGAPADPRARIDLLQRRIDADAQNGSLARHEARGSERELEHIRAHARDLYRRDRGQLSGGHEAELERRLDDLSRRLRWDRRTY